MQTIIVLAIIGACLLLVVVRGIRSLRGTKTACGCDTCPALKDNLAKPTASMPAKPPTGTHPAH